MSEEFSKNFQEYTGDIDLMRQIVGLNKGYKDADVIHALLIFLSRSFVRSGFSEEDFLKACKHYFTLVKEDFEKDKAKI